MRKPRSCLCHSSVGQKLCWALGLEITVSLLFSSWSSKILNRLENVSVFFLVSKYLSVSINCYYKYSLNTPISSSGWYWTDTWEISIGTAPPLPSRVCHPETEQRQTIYMEKQSSGNGKSTTKEGSSEEPGTAEVTLLGNKGHQLELSQQDRCNRDVGKAEEMQSRSLIDCKSSCCRDLAHTLYLTLDLSIPKTSSTSHYYPSWVGLQQFPRGGRRTELSSRLPWTIWLAGSDFCSP